METAVMPEVKAPLFNKIKEADLTKCAIFLGAGVDPDGLASQATMVAIIEHIGGKADSFYRGTFNRPQNRTIKEVLNLHVIPEEEFKKEDYSCVISVDGPSKCCPVIPDFIIDHHEQDQEAKIGSDVRQVGAVSSILLEYAIEAGIDFSTEEGSKLATALAIGIITDTDTGSTDSSSDIDFEALGYCLKYKDNKLYKEIQNYPKPSYYNDLFVIGWQNREVEGTVLVTGLGTIPRARSGVISDLAEKYSGTDGVNTAVVYAHVDGNICISVRSSNTAINVDDFVKTAFGGGGGKRGAGAVQLELPNLLKDTTTEMDKALSEAIFSIIKHKAFEIAGDGLRRKEE